MSVVLIVEDEPLVRVVAETILNRAGHLTLSASSVPQALDIIRSGQKIDVLFTDMTLANRQEGGLEVGLAAGQCRPGLPVIYTSAKSIPTALSRCGTVAQAFLPKPYSRDQLVDAVSELMAD